MEIKLPIVVFYKFKPTFNSDEKVIGFYNNNRNTQNVVMISKPRILDELNARHSKTVFTLPFKTSFGRA